jgi:cellulose synthase/poly-beta-1,6-N-acetylglucosamine synthase-like glycosyltransferase
MKGDSLAAQNAATWRPACSLSMPTLTPLLLRQALVQHSPRYRGARSSWRAVLIHLLLLGLWAGLLHEAWVQRSVVMAWSLGIAYVSYDSLLLLFVATQTWRLWRKPDTNQPALTPLQARCRPTLAVIVAAHNEASVLPVTLQALLDQTDRPDQIIIADDGSSDHTESLLTERWALCPPALGKLSAPSTRAACLRWLRLPHGGKARALNQALCAVSTDIVLTVDGDTLLERGAIQAVRRAFMQDSHLVAATGVITPVCGKDWRGRLFQWFQTYEYIRNFLSRYAWARLNSLLLVSGAFASFRREAVLTVGGFDENCLVEDYELIHRLHRHARDQMLPWRVTVLGDAQAHTDAPSTLPTFLRQRQRWFGGFLQTQFWYRDMVANPRMGALGMLMLPVKALDTLQPIYGLTAFVLLLAFVATGRFMLVGPIVLVMLTKVAIDLSYHLWSIHLYRRWVGDPHRANLWQAVATSILEPLSFQLLRHFGAALGWWSVLTGDRAWRHSAQRGLGEHHEAHKPSPETAESEVRAG